MVGVVVMMMVMMMMMMMMTMVTRYNHSFLVTCQRVRRTRGGGRTTR
jgi:hypothetical protein